MTEDLEIEVQGEPVSEELEATSEPDKNGPLSRDVVSKIVDRERKKAFEKGRKEALMEIDNTQQTPEMAQQQPQQNAAPSSIGGMQQLSSQDIERMIAEKTPQLLQQHIQQQQNEQFVNSFVAKMQAAESKYPGLEAKLNELDYSTLAPVIKAANQMENTGDIMKELVDNPEKMSTLILLSYTQPQLAQKKIMDLSNSIKTNSDAKAQDKESRDPMSQLRPSSSAGMDNGAMSVSDFRKMFR